MRFADGAWHRLHPATPLLRGGLAFVAIAGFVIANLRERLVDFFFRVPQFGDDPIDEIVNHGFVGWALLGVLGVLLAIIAVFTVSWRMHTFRITDDLVEVRSGILLRTHRRARLDRIQGVSISRNLLARIFGAAKLDITVAGNDANVQLAYLGSAATDELRREILTLASGARREATEPVALDQDGAEHPDAPVSTGVRLGGLVNRRVGEFLAPELDPDAAPPESVVRIPLLRLVGSVVLTGFTVVLVVFIIAIAIGLSQGEFWPVLVVLPVILGGGSFYIRRVSRQLRYTIAGTPDGVRVGYGLLSTNNDTLPPGRIHAIGVDQPLLWRPFGWWRVRVNTAGHASRDRQNRENTTVLPVGNGADVRAVLGLILPSFTDAEAQGIIESGMVSRGGDDGFTNAPRRAAWLRPFSWRRTGFREHGSIVLLRRGVLSRDLVVVPLARLQSVALEQGPVHRMLRLASVRMQTVSGPVAAALEVVPADTALALYRRTAADAVEWASVDTSHHWGAS